MAKCLRKYSNCMNNSLFILYAKKESKDVMIKAVDEQ